MDEIPGMAGRRPERDQEEARGQDVAMTRDQEAAIGRGQDWRPGTGQDKDKTRPERGQDKARTRDREVAKTRLGLETRNEEAKTRSQKETSRSAKCKSIFQKSLSSEEHLLLVFAFLKCLYVNVIFQKYTLGTRYILSK
jgi:hypothetical protein